MGSLTLLLMRILAALVAVALAVPAWTDQPSGVTARLRGVSAVTERVAWASGSGGTILRTADGGATWQTADDSGRGETRFPRHRRRQRQTSRSCSASARARARASTRPSTPAGRGRCSSPTRIRRRSSTRWRSGMPNRGIAFSDSVDGQFVILRTDGWRQASWTRVPGRRPAARARRTKAPLPRAARTSP